MEQMFSKREQKWVDTMPLPYPPTWWDWFQHFLRLHGFLALCPHSCRVYQQRRYDAFRWWHGADDKENL